MRAWDFT